MNRLALLWPAILAVTLCCCWASPVAAGKGSHNGTGDGAVTRWTMINVTPARWQADSHLLEFPDGTRVLIDAAEAIDAPPVLVPFLLQHGVKRLDLVVISHFHKDHYGRLRDLIAAGIKIGGVAINLPASREIADRETPWGMNWDDVQALLKFLRERKIPYFTPRTGDRLVSCSTTDHVRVRLEVVCLYDGIHTPVGTTSVNDTSILLRLTHGSSRALFTGDLDSKLGAWLATSKVDLKADILKMPHHGGEANPPNTFYDRVAPRIALVPTSRELWGSPRCMRVRTYLADNKIPTYVSGLDGNVTVQFRRDGFEVSTQTNPQAVFYPTAKR